MNAVVTLFPIGAILVSVFAAYFPEYLAPLRSAIVPLLGVVMFGMGMTLKADDFVRVLWQPKLIMLGVSLQYLLMPLIAWLLGQFLQLPLPLLAGLVLVGACPGGTASNVICFLARGNVALSITLTAISTLLAVLLTPWLTWLYVGQKIAVPTADMMWTIVRIILVPVTLGVLVNTWFGSVLDNIKRWLPVLSAIVIILIIGIIVARNATQLSQMALTVIIAVILHNCLGLLSGYYIPRMLGFDRRDCRTLAIEVGMQNSGLGVALADRFFSSLAALPGAIFSIWHNLSGAILAAVWSRQQKVL